MKKKPRPTHFLLLNNDIPSLGTGWRAVTLKKLGRKWAHFSSTADGTNYKLPVKKWEELTKLTEARLDRSGISLSFNARSVRFDK